jgi:formylmethanofuran--tetrahydromethanopterin N-formyltransferase
VGGGNLLIIGRTRGTTRAAAEAAAAAIAKIPDVIAPFPGGIVRSGSKVGSKYKGVAASTNDAFCPTLRGAVKTALDGSAGSVLEIVIDGLTSEAVASAMRAGIAALIKLGPKRGATRITAGNYGGRLGPHHYHLRDLLP